MSDRFIIKNTNTGNIVETWRTSEQAISACNFLNKHNVEWNKSFPRCNVEWNKSFPRCIVIDKDTGEKFVTNLEYKL